MTRTGRRTCSGTILLAAVFPCLLLACCIERPSVASPETPRDDNGPATQPYFTYTTQQTEYNGPGREQAAPTDLKEVRIGWFGPSDPDHPLGGGMWRAATLALEEANAAGGCNGLPFRLMPAWSENPWSTGIQNITRLVYQDRVWALIGSPDGPAAHLVEQVVVKARLTFVNPVSTDKTTNLVNIPWIFSCAPGDHIQSPVLARAVAAQAGQQGFVLIAATDHDSRLKVTEFAAALQQLKTFPKRRLDIEPGANDFSPQIDMIRDARPAAVVVLAGPKESGLLVKAIRAAAITLPIYAGTAAGHRLFIREAGESAEGVRFPLVWDPESCDESRAFLKKYVERYHETPDYTAAYTHDAMNLLIAAVRKGGLNRPLIHDALRQLSPWHGVTGTIRWNPANQNNAPVLLGVIRSGTAVPDSQPSAID